MYSLDQFFEERIGLGKAQYVSILALCLVDMNDGAQLVLSSFLGPILEKELNLTSSQVSTMTSIFYLGILFGSLVSGKFADKYGRKPVILCGSLFQFFVCCSFAIVNKYETILFVRFLYGLSFGLTIALTTTMFSQIVPLKYRGKGLLIINFCVSLGKVFSFILGAIFLQNFTKGNWKMMMVCSSFPSLIVVILVIVYMQQSARFLLAIGRQQQSFRILNKMLQLNDVHQPLSEQQKQLLLEWNNITFQNQAKGEISILFTSQYAITTITLSCCWFLINYIYFGQLIVLPFIFGRQQKSLSSYLYTVLGEAPALIVSFLMIDRPEFGRRRSLIIFFFLAGATFSVLSFKSLTFISSLCRFFMKLCFQMLYPLTTQSFGTLVRTTGFGFCSAVGRLGSVIMPYMVFPLLNHLGAQSVFIVFAIVAFLGSISAYQIPKDTVGIDLDGHGHYLQQTQLKNNLN